MNPIVKLIEEYKVNKVTKVTARHELADSVDYIEKKIGLTGKYNYKFWLGRIKRKGMSNFQVKELVDEAQKMDKKYNKGGWLNNQLT